MPAKDFVYRQIDEHLIHKDDRAIAVTLLTAGAAVGASSVTVASIAGLADGDTYRVGSGEDVELNRIQGAPSGSTVTLKYPLAKLHKIGESTRRMISYDYGPVVEDGCTVTIEADSLDVGAAGRRTVLTQLNGYARALVEGGFVAFTAQILAAVLGMLISRVTGAGTAADPHQLLTAGDEFGEDVNACVSIRGQLVDGSVKHIELHGVDFDHTVVNASLSRGQLASLPYKAKASSQVVFQDADPGYTVNTSLKATGGKTFDAISEVGVYSATSGLNTTLSVLAAAGANAFTVVDSTGAAPGDRVRFGSLDTAEVHIVDTVPDATHITTRTRTLRKFAVGTVVVERAQTAFGGVAEDGVKVEISGDKRDVKLATKRFEAGSIPGMGIITVSWMLIDILLSNICYALGIPQAAISSGRLVAGNNVGTSDIGEIYSRGLQKDGTTVEVDAYGCVQQVNSVALKLTQKEIAKLPITARPTSCLAVRTYL